MQGYPCPAWPGIVAHRRYHGGGARLDGVIYMAIYMTNLHRKNGLYGPKNAENVDSVVYVVSTGGAGAVVKKPAAWPADPDVRGAV